MNRHLARGGLFLTLVAAVLGTATGQPGGVPDKIYYRDVKADNKLVSRDGTLKESPTGYQLVAGGKVERVLSPRDIVRVVPGDVPGLKRDDVLVAADAEEKGDPQKTLAAYQELRKKATGPAAQRYLDYKVAMFTSRAADDGKASPEEAEKTLSTFVIANSKGWEVWPAGRALARVQTELGKNDAAVRTWDRLAKSTAVPPDLRAEATLEKFAAMMRSRTVGVAAEAAEAAKSFPTAGPVREKLAIIQAAAKADPTNPTAAVAEVQKLIDAAKDQSVRATGYNAIGELYLGADQPREAMWAFLWVETVFNQDRDEVFKAMVRLREVFTKLNDKDKADFYDDKIRRVKAT